MENDIDSNCLIQLKDKKGKDGKVMIIYHDSRDGQLKALHDLRDIVLEEVKALMSPVGEDGGRPITPTGLVALGLIERQLSYIDASIVLHEKGMFRQISPFARIVLDAVARYNGIFYASDSNEYVRTLLGEGSLRVLSDRHGERMRDDRLQNLLARRCPYSRDMYTRLNEEIHFGRTMTGRIMEENPVTVSEGFQQFRMVIGASTIPWSKEAKHRTNDFIMSVLAYRYTGPEDAADT